MRLNVLIYKLDRNFFDDRDSPSETDVHGNHSNIMSIQNMLNNSTNALMRQEAPPEDEDYTEKSWRSEKKRSREVGTLISLKY